MLRALSLLSTACTFLCAAAAPAAAPASSGTPKFSLPFAARVNATGFPNILAADQARAKAFKARGSSGAQRRAGPGSIDVTNTAVTYIASIGVGNPPTYYDCLIDTGSSNTFIGTGKPYVKTSSSKATGQLSVITYGSGLFIGQEYTDTVTLSPDLVISKQSIGVADKLLSQGFHGLDGILGIGPTALTKDTVLGENGLVPTVTDNLASQGTIPTNSVSVFYAPTTSTSDTNGELTFGGVDTSKNTSSIHYVPITTTTPASEYWGIDQSISYGATTILPTTAGIVDTGTTLILLATDAFNKYKSSTGGVADGSTGLLKITPAQYDSLQPLHFNVDGETYTLSPNAQIWPRALNAQIGGDASSIYLVVGDMKSNSGEGLDFINGFAFLQRFYSVYDTTNKRVGFAATEFTDAESN